MVKKAGSKKTWQSFILNDALFWPLMVLTSIAFLGFFIIPFLFRSPSLSIDVPLLSYVSILFYFLCFWLLNKKTEPKK